MNNTHRTLPQESKWDCTSTVDDLIAGAAFAVMSTYKGFRCVTLCWGNDDDQRVWHTFSLTWHEGDGLHVDGEGSIGHTFLQNQIEAGTAEVTRDWAECEAFLTERVAA